MKRIAIFASGNGSNAENIINYFHDNPEIEVSMVLTNRSKAGVIERAERHHIPVIVFTKDEFLAENGMLSILQEKSIDLIVLAGFLLKVPDYLTVAFDKRIINIHPSLLPKYGGKGMYGRHVHQAVMDAKELESGITIHFVNENYDEGAVIFQAKCDVDPNSDTPESLAEKIHSLEGLHFPKVVHSIVNEI